MFDSRATYITGKLISSTAFHSFQFSGMTEKSFCRIGVYRSPKCKTIDRIMAKTSTIFSQTGSSNSDSLDDSAFMALNISITTKLEQRNQSNIVEQESDTYMERETVEADLAMLLENIWHPSSGNSVEHLWKFAWVSNMISVILKATVQVDNDLVGKLTRFQNEICGPSGLNMNHHA